MPFDFKDIKEGRAVFGRSAKIFEINLVSTLEEKLGFFQLIW